ncbi:hypothetical protein C1H46_038652 [Malus baccata]|uniref:Uncharacterized protein n=1 Tax=Malus baccata TaxID=106549 RepID=A0A540KNL4_MALBA|nr:hypothetical protein C1H46_038652 [Malus baccata]
MFVDDVVRNEGAGVSSGGLEVALENLGSSPMKVVADSTSVNVLPSSDKSLATHEDFKLAMIHGAPELLDMQPNLGTYFRVFWHLSTMSSKASKRTCHEIHFA